MKSFGPYSPIRQVDNLLFIAGQVGVNPATGHALPDIESQTRQAIRNLQSVLHETPLSNVIKVTVYLRNMDDYRRFNDIYQSYFEAPRPARTCVGIASLPSIGDSTLLIELDAIAVKDNGDS